MNVHRLIQSIQSGSMAKCTIFTCGHEPRFIREGGPVHAALLNASGLAHLIHVKYEYFSKEFQTGHRGKNVRDKPGNVSPLLRQLYPLKKNQVTLQTY